MPCDFCLIARGEGPATIVREWDDALAIVPLGPVTGDRYEGRGHILVIPRVHVADYTEDPEVTAAVSRRAAELGAELGCESNRITSKGRAATQTVFHLHEHIVLREAGDGLPLPWSAQAA